MFYINFLRYCTLVLNHAASNQFRYNKSRQDLNINCLKNRSATPALVDASMENPYQNEENSHNTISRRNSTSSKRSSSRKKKKSKKRTLTAFEKHKIVEDYNKIRQSYDPKNAIYHINTYFTKFAMYWYRNQIDKIRRENVKLKNQIFSQKNEHNEQRIRSTFTQNVSILLFTKQLQLTKLYRMMGEK